MKEVRPKASAVRKTAGGTKPAAAETKEEPEEKTAGFGKKSLDDYDPEMRKLILAEMRKAERRRKLLIFLLVLITLGGFGAYGLYYMNAGKGDDRGGELSHLVGNDVLANMPDKGDGSSQYVATVVDEKGLEVKLEVLEKYKTLYYLNKDLIGWLKIDDTNIDGPVMQADDNEYYLSHNFDRDEDKAGTLFLDSRCDIVRGNDNFIIYGHHLQSGRMFSKLGEYESEAYYDKHPYILFDTIYEEGRYQVMYAFRSRVYDADEVVFKYYQFLDAASEEEFYSNLAEMKRLSYYDTGVTAVYGDRLLTLSTCDYNEENGRFVVVAKKIQ
ncbi:MAG: class B sortase [Lachnospiraceae bacterium]|nr:class B sortase [Lachnospiraceae bacterium]